MADGNGKVDDGSSRGNPLMREEIFKASCANEMALLALMDKTGYYILQENGQRKYGGPPPDWEGPPPPRGCEVFVGKIPRDMFEDELVPLFESAGGIYELRLMMEFSGNNRGYAFIKYTNREAAQRAIETLDNYQVRPGKFIGVRVSSDNCRLFIGSLPKDKWKDQIMEEMKKVTDGVVDVIVFPSSTDKSVNRGFAFVEYESHKAAAMAKRKLISGTFQLWGHSIQVNWAKPVKNQEKDTTQRVTVLYVQNLMLNTTEDTLYQEFSRFKPGSVEWVRKLSNYAFIYYRSYDDAVTALCNMNGALIDGAMVNVTLAKLRGIKHGEGPGWKHRDKKYQRDNATEGEVAFAFHRDNGGMMGTTEGGVPPFRTDSPCLEKTFYSPAEDHLDRCMLPLLPGTQLTPTSMLLVKQAQTCSAVSLLDLYCSRNNWAQPEYHLFSTPRHDGMLLLLYKVVISATQMAFFPHKLCLLLEDAKELAAQNALRNLEELEGGDGEGGTV